MTFEDRDIYGVNKGNGRKGPGPDLMGAGTLVGDSVYNLQGEHLGDIKEFMLNMRTGTVVYAVLSFGGLFSIGEKLFAVPWDVLKLDTANKRFVLDVHKEHFDKAPGFDSSEWPDIADQSWADRVRTYYAHSTR